ncbi:MAG: Thiol-disulfide oxidoreductase ResA [Gemmatimonadaceae bacterium]|nr:Thiol-disulfide oxidoreductase ResA [Gemmatimonadaceae bacterium]
MNWRRYLTLGNVLTALVLIWAVPRLLPHLGAMVGVPSGGNVRPAFDIATLDGRRLTIDSLRGHVVLVNFWATWCLPCRVEMPALQSMHDRHRAQGFEVVGFSVDRGGADGVREFARERGISYPIAIVGAGEERAFGGVRGYPTSFLLDRSGAVRHAVIGPIAPATLELAVRRLLKDSL